MGVPKVRFCLNCGLLIGKYGKSGYCSSCLRKHTWKKHIDEGYKPTNNTRYGMTREDMLLAFKDEICKELGI
jgi:hypothetical protein